MSNRARIEFEVGDRVRCLYYKVTGIIQKIAPDPNCDKDEEGQNIITIHKDGGAPDDCVYTKVMIKSANERLPNYLQMICKRRDLRLPKPTALQVREMVRVVNLSTLAEYSFSGGTDPAYAVYYAYADEKGMLTHLFDRVHNGFTDWASDVGEGERTYCKGDWCAFKPDAKVGLTKLGLILKVNET